jgi:hypothetical protein
VLREYGSSGKMNAFHLIVRNAPTSLIEFLLKLRIDPDHADYDEVTPFNLLSSNVAA